MTKLKCKKTTNPKIIKRKFNKKAHWLNIIGRIGKTIIFISLTQQLRRPEKKRKKYRLEEKLL